MPMGCLCLVTNSLVLVMSLTSLDEWKIPLKSYVHTREAFRALHVEEESLKIRSRHQFPTTYVHRRAVPIAGPRPIPAVQRLVASIPPAALPRSGGAAAVHVAPDGRPVREKAASASDARRSLPSSTSTSTLVQVGTSR
jgi:hypothetical protein